MPELHPATRGFDAGRYERGRPGYPAAAVDTIVDELDLRPGRTVLDLAAGTGKLTRLLVPSGAEVIAVEPLDALREAIGDAVVALSGTAERIPLGDGSVDAVTVGQAFHWFDADVALREIHRVLRRGGGLALIWNIRDERDPLQAALTEIIDPLEGETPIPQKRDWEALLAGSGVFGRICRFSFDHVQPVDTEQVVDRVLSISYVGVAPEDVRADVAQRVREVAKDATQLSYVTRLYLAWRQDDSRLP